MKNVLLKVSICSIFLILLSYRLSFAQQTQNRTSDSLIAASQTGAMPLIFSVNQSFGNFAVSDFKDEKEFSIRGGLPNFFSKAKSGKPLTIAYLGGSITRADECYRMQFAANLQNIYPTIVFKSINAGISGTGTDLGACRLQEQVLNYHPDVVFVEFAVNGGPNEAMEGIIRQIIKHNPQTDICLIYTIYKAQTRYYSVGKYPPNIESLDKLAVHYNLPSIHLGMETSILEKEDKLVFAAANPVLGKIVFSKDGVHPTQEGGNLYAAAMARAFNKMKNGAAEITSHALPKPLLKGNWEDAHWYPFNANISFSKGWKEVGTDKVESFKQFNPWFSTVMQAEKAGEYLSFSFVGDAFGIFDIGGPEVGQLAIELDGKKVKLVTTANARIAKAVYTDSIETALLNRFNINCNNRYRGQFDIVEVEAGKHQVKLFISDRIADKKTILGNNVNDITLHPAKYDQTKIYLGRLLIRGELESLKHEK